MKKLNLNSRILLNNGINIPVIGIGTYRVEDGEPVTSEIKWALEAGYRLIDTASAYNNEEGVGRAIAESGIPREKLFITTKLQDIDEGYASTLRAIDVSLTKLELTYVDLYLIHWPTASPNHKISINKRDETWKAMEEICKSGKAKAIGVSNYTITHLEEMKKYSAILPVINQVEFHPFLYQKELLDYCKENSIALQAHSPLASGNISRNDVIGDIAKKHGKNNTHILIRWSLQHGLIPIPKSIHKERIEENIQVFDFELSEEDMVRIDDLNENLRFRSNPENLK
ncbi:MAG: glyoxal reductase [Candidatus Liptonbacteria bacterium RIFCSPLOWO2_01_FULL_45_15]|uniref:Glyoxal reductase n=1 Tax=Candidatus Liptonbacteria bacterium RIFCSPLOWO2_01_FULL_45_15 TaxID=1798649 RepID=A0A1G2CC43_9BACT|nr:MAG: glyoxal reductase [Candidatus Liptonbacteria bacterium RIFCSPLOWO2_01_FULL_45_15]